MRALRSFGKGGLAGEIAPDGGRESKVRGDALGWMAASNQHSGSIDQVSKLGRVQAALAVGYGYRHGYALRRCCRAASAAATAAASRGCPAAMRPS